MLLSLRGEHTLGLRTVPLALGVLLERVLHRHLLAAQELAVEVLDRLVGRLKVVEADETVTLGLSCAGVARDLQSAKSKRLPSSLRSTHLWLFGNRAESRKRVVQLLLGHALVEVSNEEVCANVNLLLIVRGLVDADRLAEQLDLVHDLARVVCVVF